VLQRSKAGWRSWEYSDPSPGRGCPATTPTRNPCSVRPNTGLTTQAGHSRARRPSANGCPHLWTGTTTGTVTAGASSSLLGSDTVAKLWTSIVAGLSSTNRHTNDTRAGGHGQRVAGINRKWSGLIPHHQKSKSIRLC
jgi:hypothetical protein